jgi:ribosome-associated protein
MASTSRGGTAAAKKPPKSRGTPVRTAAITVARALDALRAAEVLVLDVGAVSPIAEIFVIATGSNPRHVKALADETIRSLRALEIRHSSVDGADQGYWAVVDYGPLVVHLFQPQARQYYDLEMLWGDGKKVRWKAPAKAKAE